MRPARDPLSIRPRGQPLHPLRYANAPGAHERCRRVLVGGLYRTAENGCQTTTGRSRATHPGPLQGRSRTVRAITREHDTMKITDVKADFLKTGRTMLRIFTDDGIVGLAEAGWGHDRLFVAWLD